ncbi:hypothetical protein [Halogranum rubrum]|uniref:Uncharacterized protein n=1 Tax=Halogranum salarium B-1 TaxID=1210908 RepID=J2ZHQ9_9EURY|nr:hypothetical protein [Halogranum salarium]EJN60220.1 hypothetical protein HSB1_08230 [Halogranum salarium B-1]
MSKKDRYSHLGGDADEEETSDEPEAETAVDEEEADEPTEEVEAEASEEVEAESSEEVETEAESSEEVETEAESTEEVENDSPDESASDSVDEPEGEPADELDDGAIRVTISDGDEEREVVIDADEGVTTDDVVHAVQHAGQEAETPKTMWGSWVRMASSLGKARLAAVTVASLLTVKGLTMVVRRFRRRD